MSLQMPPAKYPNSVWDTLTQGRNSRNDYISPGPEEYMRLLAELEALEIDLIPTAEENIIWVSPNGRSTGTGSIVNPFATLATAFAAITVTKKTVMARPGVYNARITLPVTQDGIKIIGVGGSSVCSITGADTGHTVSLAPGAQGAPFTFTLEGFTIDPPAARTALDFTLANQDDDVTLIFKDLVITKGASGGDSLHGWHDVNQQLYLYLDSCRFDWDVVLELQVAADRIFARYSRFLNTFSTSADAVAANISLMYCELKALGMYGGNGAQTIDAIYCNSGALLMVAADFSTNGSHTVTTLAPVS